MTDKTKVVKSIDTSGIDEWENIEEAAELTGSPSQLDDVVKAGPEIVIYKQTDNGISNDIFLYNGKSRSNITGDVIDRDRTLYRFAVSTRRVTTCTFKVFKNGNFGAGEEIATVELSSARVKVAVASIDVDADDELAVYIEGSARDPKFYMYAKGRNYS